MEGGKEGAGVMKKRTLFQLVQLALQFSRVGRKEKKRGGKSAFFSSVLKRRITKHQRFKCKCTDLLSHTFRFFPPKARVCAEPKQQQQKNNEYNKQKRPTNTNKSGEILEARLVS